MDTQKMFSSLVSKYFDFLIKDYDFKKTENLYAYESLGDGIITYQSSKVILSLTKDRFDYWDSIRPIAEPDNRKLSIFSIIYAITQDNEFENLILSAPMQTTVILFDFRLRNVSAGLRKYCSSILRGDFSQWSKFHKISYKKKKHEMQKHGIDYEKKYSSESKAWLEYIKYAEKKFENN